MNKVNQVNKVFNIILIGDSGVGKSSILKRFVDLSFNEDDKNNKNNDTVDEVTRRVDDACDDDNSCAHIPTVGFDVRTKSVMINNQTYKLHICDIFGNISFVSLTPTYYSYADAVIFVYDVTVEQSFKSMCDWMEYVRIYCKPNIPIIIAGNKTDIDTKSNTEQCTHEHNGRRSNPKGHDFSCSYESKAIKVSAKTGKNISYVFTSLTHALVDHKLPSVDHRLPSVESCIQKGVVRSNENKDTQKCKGFCAIL